MEEPYYKLGGDGCAKGAGDLMCILADTPAANPDIAQGVVDTLLSAMTAHRLA